MNLEWIEANCSRFLLIRTYSNIGVVYFSKSLDKIRRRILYSGFELTKNLVCGYPIHYSVGNSEKKSLRRVVMADHLHSCCSMWCWKFFSPSSLLSIFELIFWLIEQCTFKKYSQRILVYKKIWLGIFLAAHAVSQNMYR